MQKLRYNKKWVEYDFITEQEINLQIEQFESGEDKNDEHFRYKTLLEFIRSKENFSDLQIERFIEIIKLDSDQAMAGSAFSVLMKSGKLSQDQFQSSAIEFAKYGKWAQKIIDRLINDKVKKADNKR